MSAKDRQLRVFSSSDACARVRLPGRSLKQRMRGEVPLIRAAKPPTFDSGALDEFGEFVGASYQGGRHEKRRGRTTEVVLTAVRSLSLLKGEG